MIGSGDRDGCSIFMNPFEQKQISPLKSVSEKPGLGVGDLKRIIELKERSGADATVEKIELIEKINDIQYSPEEKTAFDDWRKEIPPNSKEQPIQVDDPQGILDFLPGAPNYKEEAVGLFFSSLNDFSGDDLDRIFKSFSRM